MRLLLRVLREYGTETIQGVFLTQERLVII